MKTAPAWVDKTLFPFTSRWIKIDENEIHYVDEGAGDVILFVHGTPEWSFGYRDLIKDLKNNFRCIALDMLGFGLSDKPPGEDYTCQGHALRLAKFIRQLDLKNIHFVLNDFGGGIGLHYAIHHPENVNNIVLFNTWMWSLKDDPHYSKPAKVMKSWFGKLMYQRLNFPVNTMMPVAFGNRKILTPEIHNHYKNALPDPASRMGTYTFAREIMDAADWWENLWSKTDSIKQKRFLIFWGMKDKLVPVYELEKWKSKLPEARVITFDDAGHFVQEEKAKEMTREIGNWLIR